MQDTIIARPILMGILMWRKALPLKLKSYIDNHLNLTKANIIDPRKENFVQPLSILEILAEIQMVHDKYDRVFSISKDDNLELNLKKKPICCLVNSD